MRISTLIVMLLLSSGALAQVDSLWTWWTAPTTGGDVDNYVVRIYTTVDTLLTATTADTHYTFGVDQVVQGQPYRFSVSGENTDGEGPSARTTWWAWGGSALDLHQVVNLQAQRSGGSAVIEFSVGSQDGNQIQITAPGVGIWHMLTADSSATIPSVDTGALDVTVWPITSGEQGTPARTQIAAQ